MSTKRKVAGSPEVVNFHFSAEDCARIERDSKIGRALHAAMRLVCPAGYMTVRFTGRGRIRVVMGGYSVNLGQRQVASLAKLITDQARCESGDDPLIGYVFGTPRRAPSFATPKVARGSKQRAGNRSRD